MNFTKIFSSIITSSLWLEPPEVLKVFIYFACNPLIDQEGIVKGSIPAMAHQCVMSVPEFEKVLGVLTSPDGHSRTEAHEGRRLIKVEGGFKVVNYRRYRDTKGTGSETNRTEYMRDYMRGYRSKGSVNSVNNPVNPVNNDVSNVSSVNTDVDVDVDEDVDVEETDLCSSRPSGEAELCSPLIPEQPEPPPIREKIKELLKRYPEQDLIGRTIQALGSTRRTGSMADSVLFGILTTWARYSVDAVQAGCRIYLDEDCARDRGKRENYLAGIIRRQEDLIRDSGLDPGFKGTESQTSLPAPRINRGPVHARDIVTETMAAQERKEAQAQVEAEKYRSWQTQVLNELSKKPDLRARLEAEAQEKVSPLSAMGFGGERLEQAFQANLAELAAQELGIPRAEKVSTS